MTYLKNIKQFLRTLYLEGMLHRTEDGEKLGFMSKRGWGSNMMLGGIIGLLIAVFWFAQRAHFERDAISTTSEVLAVARDSTNDGNVVYELTLRWTDQNGDTQVTVPRVKATRYNVPVGTVLNIKYDPSDPSDVRVETEEGPWYLPRLIGLSSIMSIVFGRLLRGHPKA